MENIIEFIGNNYAWFLTITIILLFALIGYIVDSKRNKNDLLKKTETTFLYTPMTFYLHFNPYISR